jgi:hypothetical protein
MHQDRPHHGLCLSILNGPVLIPKPTVKNNGMGKAQRRIIPKNNAARHDALAHRHQHRQAAEMVRKG